MFKRAHALFCIKQRDFNARLSSPSSRPGVVNALL